MVVELSLSRLYLIIGILMLVFVVVLVSSFLFYKMARRVADTNTKIYESLDNILRKIKSDHEK